MASDKKAYRRYLNSVKGRDERIDAQWTPFRAAEKYYKARYPRPDLSKAVDLALLDPNRKDEIQSGIWTGTSSSDLYRDITSPSASVGTKIYTVPSVPGLVILPSFLSPPEQRRLIKWALCEHARPPNTTNLDVHYDLPAEGLWNAYLKSRDAVVMPRKDSTPDQVQIEPPGPRKLINNDAADEANFEFLQTVQKLDAAPSLNAKPTACSILMRKLRWANIGWFYHWGTKQYDFTRGKADIDDKLTTLCQKAVAAVDWSTVFASPLDWGEKGEEWQNWGQSYEPDAGIVNFYQTNDTLMAHVDRSEVCATSPLVSISLGNAAIFLIGGSTRDTEPIPVLLRSGDIVIMAGPVCRRAYHGIPRILDGTLPQYLTGQTNDYDWMPYAELLGTTRINVNVRQVFPKGFDPGLAN